MTTAPLPRTATVDAWTLRTMREAKAYRDSIGEPDAYWDARLAAAEAAQVIPSVERPASFQGDPGSRTGAGMVGGASNRNAATPAQIAYIAKLAADLGYELQTPRDKSHASLIINGAKRALATKPAAARVERKATERQVEFLASLLSERMHQLGEPDPTTMSAARASELIERLMAAPRAQVAAHGIREGRYAYAIAEGEARFYRVTRTGRIRVQAGPSEHPYNGALNTDLQWIKANPREAAALYGQLIEKCGRCGLPLTDDDSRARGLGPVCASKTEW